MQARNNYKIAFFGTPDFTVDFLKTFKSAGFKISLVVTNEDKPQGRGQTITPPLPKVWALDNEIVCLQPRTLDKEFIAELKKTNWDLFIVIAYGKIIPQEIIDMPKHGTINLHYSLLPKYRGASPVESAILNNETKTGITIQKMKFKLDAGDILLQEKVNMDNTQTASELRGILNRKAIDMFPTFLDDYLSNKIVSIPQNENEATNCSKFSKADLNVSESLLNGDLETVYRKYKAHDKKIYFFHKNKGTDLRVKITGMQGTEILKVLPESKKEISKVNFEKTYGKI
jgi:methionyl-tRNA formyltransferase